ncbi:retransposons RT-DIRS1: reverse transcriptase family [Brachionus plicatilis]|uniref:Retransposons RT-DIRS1: reverse transcriptase family n=1 Tax=Brachionus plicatilis TaxID=10195 RepID=A0A3M7T3D2_BRAPC|nr:retransposons RT-DIRS1: reverse transcriptase family [Brachionus plicatilis]
MMRSANAAFNAAKIFDRDINVNGTIFRLEDANKVPDLRRYCTFRFHFLPSDIENHRLETFFNAVRIDGLNIEHITEEKYKDRPERKMVSEDLYDPPNVLLNFEFFKTVNKKCRNYILGGDLRARTKQIGCVGENENGIMSDRIINELDFSGQYGQYDPTHYKRADRRTKFKYDLSKIKDLPFYPYTTLDLFFDTFDAPSRIKKNYKHGVYLDTGNVKWKRSISRKANSLDAETATEAMIQQLIDRSILVPDKKSPFLANASVVPKPDGTPRLIIDYSHLRKVIKAPKQYLPSVYEIFNKQKYLAKTYFNKLDLMNAFYNIPLHPDTDHVTMIRFKRRFYKFTRLPMGIQSAPYHCHKIMTVVADWIRKKGFDCSIHMDGILVSSHRRASHFLGAQWSIDKLQRPKEPSAKMNKVSYFVKRPHKLNTKNRQELVGYFNYFATYAGKISTFSRILLNNPKDISKSYLIYQLFRNVITKFKTYRIPDDPVQYHLVSDATTDQFGFIMNNKCAFAGQFNRELAITLAETITVLIALKQICDHAEEDNVSIICQIDNTGTIAAIKKNRMKYKSVSTIGNLTLSDILRRQRNLFETRVAPVYIMSEANPADALSRIRWNEYNYQWISFKNFLRFPNQEELLVKSKATRIALALKRQASKSEQLLSKKQKLPVANMDVHVDEAQLAENTIPPSIRKNEGTVTLELFNSQMRYLSDIPSLRDELDQHELNFEGTRYQQAYIPTAPALSAPTSTVQSFQDSAEPKLAYRDQANKEIEKDDGGRSPSQVDIPSFPGGKSFSNPSSTLQNRQI